MVLFLLSGQAYASVTPGTSTNPPPGFVVSNLDPTLTSPYKNEIYDPNFIPGFSVGLPNTSIGWSSGNGYAKVSYSVGPWAHEEWAIPHFAMGPQCCNFVEVPHTQQFRLPNWGDYYYVRAGFGPPGVNIENYTAIFGQTTPYVGLSTISNWTLSLSLNWTSPRLMNADNEWAAIGITVTQYVASEPGKLVYTLINFWMDQNSSRYLTKTLAGVPGAISGRSLVVYHPVQLTTEGNQTLSLSLSPFLSDTIRELNLTASPDQPPLIAYVYLNVEGYNLEWNTTVWSYYLLTQSEHLPVVWVGYFYAAALVGSAVALATIALWYRSKKLSRSATQSA